MSGTGGDGVPGPSDGGTSAAGTSPAEGARTGAPSAGVRSAEPSSTVLDGSAWNPGLASTIPRRLLPAVTLFRSENALHGHAEASELSDLSGLAPTELAALRPERLIAHELLVRVTADYSVPDGPNYADLGISLRSMVATLHERHVVPELDALREAFAAERDAAAALLDEELSRHVFGGADGQGPGEAPGEEPSGPTLPTRLASWFGRRFGGAVGSSTAASRRSAPPRRSPSRVPEPPETAALRAWRAELDAGGTDPEPPRSLRRACLEALVRTIESIVAHRGRLLADRDAVRKIALVLVGNTRGAERIGELLAPIVRRGAEREGYRPLPVQEKPLIMNVKGASASGKSTIRPRQRELARELGVAWEDFALISPDYWRKYLLDYDSLGDDRRYGAMLCGQELELVDRKLDRHMAAKAARGEMSHLLIDRFRFDSFTLERDRTAESRLLTRFGHEIYLFFVITPPVETVERAWARGLSTGRYKAVDDLLHHNVEAFTGMPALFLSWVTASDRRVHVEFLDNGVPEGALPLTGAFGWNDALVILDVALMRAIDRYREIDVEALRPEDVLRPAEASCEPAFVLRAAERIRRIDFADRDTAHVYARVEGGRVRWTDEAHIARRPDVDDVRAVLGALPGGDPSDGERSGAADDVPSAPPPIDVDRERHYTVGRWASATTPAGDARPSADARPASPGAGV